MNTIDGRETSLEELQERLRQMSASELLKEMEELWYSDDPDPDLLLVYDAILDEKEPMGPPFDAGAARIELDARLRGSDSNRSIPAPKDPQRTKPIPKASSRPRGRPLQSLAAVAILITVLLCAAQAGKLFKAFNMGDGTYSVLADSGSMEIPAEIDSDYHSLQEALDFYGIKENLAPTWIPSTFSAEKVKVYLVDGETLFSASYTKAEAEDVSVINVRILDDPHGASIKHESNEEAPEEYEVNDITFYITQNFEQYTAYWTSGRFNCGISGDITEDELKSIINSIFKESKSDDK